LRARIYQRSRDKNSEEDEKRPLIEYVMTKQASNCRDADEDLTITAVSLEKYDIRGEE
jgi:hypothetical protein